MNEQNNTSRKIPPPRGVRDEKRWTLLFIGDRGKTVTFYHFKALVITGLIFIITSVAAGAWFYHLYRNGLRETRTLRTEIKNLKRALDSERHEKEIVTARLVVSESRMEKSRAKTKSEKPLEIPEKKPASAPPKPAGKPVLKPPTPPVSVSVENFLVFYEPDINSLRVEYKVINKGSRSQPVSGRTVVVLKDDNAAPDKWLILPRVPLIEGRPTSDKGRSFTIRNFRTMRFKSNNQVGPDKYKTATVYIYTTTGTLLLEKEYPVGIKARTISQKPKPKDPPRPAPKKQQPKPATVKRPERETNTEAQRSTASARDSSGESVSYDLTGVAVEEKPASAPSESSPEPAEKHPQETVDQLGIEVELP
jgi:hypothetical protein